MNGPVVAVVAPGMMGAGVGQRLVKRGLKVLTSTAGRSPSTVKRAGEAGMRCAFDVPTLAQRQRPAAQFGVGAGTA